MSHITQGALHLLGCQMALLVQVSVNLRCEGCQGLIAKLRPLGRQKVIIKNINQNSRIASELWIDTVFTALHDGMGIGKGINTAMLNNCGAQPFR